MKFVVLFLLSAMSMSMAQEESFSNSEASGKNSSAQSSASGSVEPDHQSTDLDPMALAAAMVFFNNQAAFEAAAPGLPLEDFNNANVGPGGVRGCGSVISNGSSCFPGGLEEGIEISSSNGPVVALGAGIYALGSPGVAADIFSATTIVTFSNGNVFDVGLEIFLSGSSRATVEVYDLGGTLCASVQGSVGFWGVSSSEPIGSIRVRAPGNRGEVLDNIQFGNGVADSDGDGVADVDDHCPSSNIDATVVTNGCDSGVANTIFTDGCSLADLLGSCGDGNPPPWEYVNRVTSLTSDLVNDGTLTHSERNSLIACAWDWSLPTAVDDTYTTDWDSTLVVDAPGVLGNDFDPQGSPLSSYPQQGPAHGTLSLHQDGSFEYVPEPGFEGPVTFVYKAYEGPGYRKATVTINVTAGNQFPVVGNDRYTMYWNSTMTVNAPGVLGNDYDPEGQGLTAYLVAYPQGHLGFHQDGSFYYTPPAWFLGDVTFKYKAGDGIYKTRGTVTITVIR